MPRVKSLRRFFRMILLCAPWVAAASAPQKIPFDIPASTLEEALNKFGTQADTNVVFLEDHVKDMQTRRLHGRYTKEDAIKRLVSRNHLCFDFGAGQSSVTVHSCEDGHEPTELPKKAPVGPGHPRAPDGVQPAGSQLGADLESVTITGTHIPRTEVVGPGPIVLTQADFEKYGFRTLADLGRVLPQLFGGGPSQDTHRIGAETKTNSGLGNALNVRALGARATLVLLNGRRLAPSGTVGAFVDISNIPLSAVERVEILADGMSAVYGADSVAGVVNIITRRSRDENGKTLEDETSAHYWAVYQGAWREGRFSQTLSKDWGTGGLFTSAELFKNTALPARERGFSHSDLSYFGGPNLSLPESWPPTLAVGSNTWAVMPGVIGKPSVTQLVAHKLNYDDAHSNSDLLPIQEGGRLYGQAHQSIEDHLTVSVEGLQTRRQGTQLNGGDREDIPVSATSPYYFQEIGNGTPMYVERDLFNVLGPRITHVEVQTSYGALIADIPLAGDRLIKVSASRALETEQQQQTGIFNAVALSDPTVDFNPFVDRSSLTSNTLARIQGSSSFAVASELHEYGAQLTGPIVSTPGGPMTGALGAEYRVQMLRTCDSTVKMCDRYGRRLQAAFLELVVPLQTLVLSAAGRYENYSDFGHATTTPRLGFRWAPVSGLELKGSWGKSIRVPNLPDLNTARNSIIAGPDPSGAANVIYLSGNNSALKEERARTGTLELNFTREVAEDSTLGLGADYFDIHYFDRIQSVDLSTIGPDLLSNPRYESLLQRNPSQATVQSLCQSAQFFGPCPAEPYAAVVDLRLRNIDTLLTRGVDLNGFWQTRTPWGAVGLQLVGTYLLKYSDEATPTSPEEKLLDTENNPIDLQLHASVDVTYRDFGGRATVNFSNRYRDTVSVPNRPIGSWTTVDLQLRYDPVREANSAWNGVSISLDAQNVLNRNPPFLSNYVERLGYDEENADPLNRLIGLYLRKRW